MAFRASRQEVLRGLGDTRSPMLWNLAGHWVIGLLLGSTLAFVMGFGVIGQVRTVDRPHHLRCGARDRLDEVELIRTRFLPPSREALRRTRRSLGGGG
jgi:hypothetical protein